MGREIFGDGLFGDDDAWLGFKIAMGQNNDGWKFSSINKDPYGSDKLRAIFKHVVNGVEDFRRIQAHDLGELKSLAGLDFDHKRHGIPKPEVEKAIQAAAKIEQPKPFPPMALAAD